jgi:NAD(P)-dependent dehydrogenase (short-subunit alcohol dehydrogenase family)
MQKGGKKKEVRPPQQQPKPGIEEKMRPQPVVEKEPSTGRKLQDKVALITGADSGIGKAVAILFAQQGADIAVVYFSEDEDAQDTKKTIEKYGRKCLLLKGNLRKEAFCKKAIENTVKQLGKIDVLVNNAATQTTQKSLTDISTDQLYETFETNFFSMFWMSKYALPYLKKGAAIINTTSVTAYRGSPGLLDYSSTKGAITSFTRSLSANLVDKGIRVNGVAPGPIWTPLIVSSMKNEEVAKFGTDSPMKRAGQPVEVAPCYLFLASEDASYMTGQILHPNGGEIVNG